MKAQGAKRAVFADVSNVTRAVAKDDIQLGKSKQHVLKDTAIVSTKELAKPNALLRPAQRPLSTKTTGPIASEPAAAPVTKPVIEPTQIRKALLKKATTVFRETHTDSAPEVAAPKPAVELLHPNVGPEQAPVQPAVKESTARKQRASAPLDASKTEARHAHAHIEVQERFEYVDALEERALVMEKERIEELAKLQSHNDEEYWDEEDEEYFEADGYTTARSIRSRGDNTTGGVTVVLAPRITTRSKRELEAARLFVEANKTEDDIEDEQWDTSMVAEYGEEIFEYMHSLEERMRPNAHYMDLQAEIQWSMRSVLMDWLVQVHNRFTLLPETLFLSVNYVDRFLSAKVVSLGKLQLVGATALFLAAKYEEINCPSVQEIVYMVDGAYTIDEVLKAERFMLSMLQFELGWPGPMSFLRRVSKADDYDVETRTLAKYFLEITIMDERFVGCTPSYLAAGAHCLARFMLKKGDWSQAHVHYSGYTLQQLRSLLIVMLECCEAPRKHHAAVYDKYTDKRYKRASIFVENEINKGFQLPFVSRDSIAGHSQNWRRK